MVEEISIPETANPSRPDFLQQSPAAVPNLEQDRAHGKRPLELIGQQATNKIGVPAIKPPSPAAHLGLLGGPARMLQTVSYAWATTTLPLLGSGRSGQDRGGILLFPVPHCSCASCSRPSVPSEQAEPSASRTSVGLPVSTGFRGLPFRVRRSACRVSAGVMHLLTKCRSYDRPMQIRSYRIDSLSGTERQKGRRPGAERRRPPFAGTAVSRRFLPSATSGENHGTDATEQEGGRLRDHFKGERGHRRRRQWRPLEGCPDRGLSRPSSS